MLKDKEKRKQYVRSYYSRNKEKLQAYMRAYYLRNKKRHQLCAKKWRAENAGRVKKTNAVWEKANADKVRAFSQKWKARNPKKVKAARKALYAVEKGKLRRGACCFCGSTDKIEGHHEDYDKPLELTWMCHRCHMRHHTNRRR